MRPDLLCTGISHSHTQTPALNKRTGKEANEKEKEKKNTRYDFCVMNFYDVPASQATNGWNGCCVRNPKEKFLPVRKRALWGWGHVKCECVQIWICACQPNYICQEVLLFGQHCSPGLFRQSTSKTFFVFDFTLGIGCLWHSSLARSHHILFSLCQWLPFASIYIANSLSLASIIHGHTCIHNNFSELTTGHHIWEWKRKTAFNSDFSDATQHKSLAPRPNDTHTHEMWQIMKHSNGSTYFWFIEKDKDNHHQSHHLHRPTNSQSKRKRWSLMNEAEIRDGINDVITRTLKHMHLIQ